MTEITNDEHEYQASLVFLRALERATTIAEINAAAGSLLQDLGEPIDG